MATTLGAFLAALPMCTETQEALTGTTKAKRAQMAGRGRQWTATRPGSGVVLAQRATTVSAAAGTSAAAGSLVRPCFLLPQRSTARLFSVDVFLFTNRPRCDSTVTRRCNVFKFPIFLLSPAMRRGKSRGNSIGINQSAPTASSNTFCNWCPSSCHICRSCARTSRGEAGASMAGAQEQEQEQVR